MSSEFDELHVSSNYLFVLTFEVILIVIETVVNENITRSYQVFYYRTIYVPFTPYNNEETM